MWGWLALEALGYVLIVTSVSKAMDFPNLYAKGCRDKMRLNGVRFLSRGSWMLDMLVSGCTYLPQLLGCSVPKFCSRVTIVFLKRSVLAYCCRWNAVAVRCSVLERGQIILRSLPINLISLSLTSYLVIPYCNKQLFMNNDVTRKAAVIGVCTAFWNFE